MSLYRGTCVVLLAAVLIAVPIAAQAVFTKGTAAALSVSTDTLSPPTGLKATCHGSGRTAYLELTWTPTVNKYAAGYTLRYLLGSWLLLSQSVSGRTTESANLGTSVTGVGLNLVTSYADWTSSPSNTVTAPTCR